MKIIVCIDEKNGLTFGGKRQSRDSVLIDDIISLTSGKLLISPFSSTLFSGKGARIASSPLSCADEDEYVFVEDEDCAKYFDVADEVILYRWNRLYPSDLRLSALPDECGLSLSERVDFVGTSHKKITRERYVK